MRRAGTKCGPAPNAAPPSRSTPTCASTPGGRLTTGVAERAATAVLSAGAAGRHRDAAQAYRSSVWLASSLQSVRGYLRRQGLIGASNGNRRGVILDQLIT